MPWFLNPFKKQDATDHPEVLIPLQQVQRYQPVASEPAEADVKPEDGPADEDDQPLLESDKWDTAALKAEIEKDIPERKRRNPYECMFRNKFLPWHH